MKSLALGAVVGAVILFVMQFILHMFTPLGHMGYETMSSDVAVTAALKAACPESGIYGIPSVDHADMSDPDVREATMKQMEEGPFAWIAWVEEGTNPFGSNLAMQFVLNLIGAFLAAFVISKVNGGYGLKVGIVSLMGLFVWVNSHASFMVWFAYPADYTYAHLFMGVPAWVAAGFGMAKVVKAES